MFITAINDVGMTYVHRAKKKTVNETYGVLFEENIK